MVTPKTTSLRLSTAAPMAIIAAATTHQYQTGTVAESMTCR